MNARTLMLIASIALLATPALARDGSKTATDHNGTSHSVDGKGGTYHQLREEINHLNEPLANCGCDVTYGDQYDGDVANALDPNYNGGKAAITQGQARSLDKAYDRATSP